MIKSALQPATNETFLLIRPKKLEIIEHIRVVKKILKITPIPAG